MRSYEVSLEDIWDSKHIEPHQTYVGVLKCGQLLLRVRYIT